MGSANRLFGSALIDMALALTKGLRTGLLLASSKLGACLDLAHRDLPSRIQVRNAAESGKT